MTRLVVVALLLVACSSPSAAPDGSAEPDAAPSDGALLDAAPALDAPPMLCEGTCPLDIEPRRTVLGLPATSGVEATMPMWAVRRVGARPEYLTREATWHVEDPSIATVDADGVLTPVARGATRLSATLGGVTAWAEVTVAGELHAATLAHDGATRQYLLYVPDGYDAATPTSLVIAMHGGGGSSAGQLRLSQLDRIGHARSWLIVYPQGTGRLLPTWNGGNCCGAAMNDGVDDVGFLRALVAELSSEYAIDARRVYATGHSNGAIMSHRLACEAADLVAAIAPVDGGLNLGGDFAACTPSRPVPVLMFHGTTDDNYPIEGGLGGRGVTTTDFHPVRHPTEPDTLHDWITADGASTTPTATEVSGMVTCETYAGAADVVLCVSDPPTPDDDGNVVWDGGGHIWPGGVRNVQMGADVPNHDVDASERIADFFAARPLP